MSHLPRRSWQSFQVLEAVLPGLFHGLVSAYLSNGDGVHSRANGAVRATREHLSKDQRDYIMAVPELELEYRLYNFLVMRLQGQYETCGIGK